MYEHFKFLSKSLALFMSDLPWDTVVPSRYFLVSGLDYAGSFYLKNNVVANIK